MESANLDLVRSIVADWECGDYSSAEWAHPEIEFEGGRLGGGKSLGLAGMAAIMRDVLGAWERLRVHAEEFRVLDDERVLVFIRMIARGKASGLALDDMRAGAAALFYIREGMVTKLLIYGDRDRAFAELGLARDAGSER